MRIKMASSDCANAQSDQAIDIRYMESIIGTHAAPIFLKILASLNSPADWFHSYPIANPKIGFLVTHFCEQDYYVP